MISNVINGTTKTEVIDVEDVPHILLENHLLADTLHMQQQHQQSNNNTSLLEQQQQPQQQEHHQQQLHHNINHAIHQVEQLQSTSRCATDSIQVRTTQQIQRQSTF